MEKKLASLIVLKEGRSPTHHRWDHPGVKQANTGQVGTSLAVAWIHSLGISHGRTRLLASLDEGNEPGDVGDGGEQGHDAVHLVGREDAAERCARACT